MLAFTLKCTLDGDTQEAALVLGGALETERKWQHQRWRAGR